MSKIRIGGLNGKIYELPDVFTYREMRMMKRMTGIPAGRMHASLEEGDTDVIAAFALIAMQRENKTLTEDAVLDLQIDQIEFLDDEEIMTELPPTDGAEADPTQPREEGEAAS
jgi:hypothetical protein